MVGGVSSHTQPHAVQHTGTNALASHLADMNGPRHSSHTSLTSPRCTALFRCAGLPAASESDSHAILDAYVAAGGNFIDTANVARTTAHSSHCPHRSTFTLINPATPLAHSSPPYLVVRALQVYATSEECVGRWLHKREQADSKFRSSILLATKVKPHSATLVAYAHTPWLERSTRQLTPCCRRS